MHAASAALAYTYDMVLHVDSDPYHTVVGADVASVMLVCLVFMRSEPAPIDAYVYYRLSFARSGQTSEPPAIA